MTTYIDVALSTIPWVVVVLWNTTSQQPACTHSPKKRWQGGHDDCDCVLLVRDSAGAGSHRAEDDAIYGMMDARCLA